MKIIISILAAVALAIAISVGLHALYVDTHCTTVLGTQVCQSAPPPAPSPSPWPTTMPHLTFAQCIAEAYQQDPQATPDQVGADCQ